MPLVSDQISVGKTANLEIEGKDQDNHLKYVNNLVTMVVYKPDPNLAAFPLGAKSMLALDKRPWGSWEEYLHEDEYRVKRLIILPGKRFSLQKHRLRSEHWVIVQGRGKLTLGNVQKILSVGDWVFIPAGCKHRFENVGQEDLIFIETQLGICLEEDIVRLADDFGRD